MAQDKQKPGGGSGGSPGYVSPSGGDSLSIERRVLRHLEENKYKSLVIEDPGVTPAVVHNLFLALDAQEEIELGKKRCTKWRKGRRFCVQREGFLKWRFGREYR